MNFSFQLDHMVQAQSIISGSCAGHAILSGKISCISGRFGLVSKDHDSYICYSRMLLDLIYF